MQVIVITVPCNLGDPEYKKLEKKAKEAFPNNKVLLLEGGADIKVVPSD